jgi:hypothetical protein
MPHRFLPPWGRTLDYDKSLRWERKHFSDEMPAVLCQPSAEQAALAVPARDPRSPHAILFARCFSALGSSSLLSGKGIARLASLAR